MAGQIGGCAARSNNQLIAAQASLLLLHRESDYYPRLLSILVYPDAYVVPVQYDPSVLCGPATHQALAKGEQIGRRFHSAPVVRLSDATGLSSVRSALEGDSEAIRVVPAIAPAADMFRVAPTKSRAAVPEVIPPLLASSARKLGAPTSTVEAPLKAYAAAHGYTPLALAGPPAATLYLDGTVFAVADDQ